MRARALLDRVGLVDGHNDLPWTLRETFESDLSRVDLRKRGATVDTDIPRLREGRVSRPVLERLHPVGTVEPRAHPARADRARAPDDRRLSRHVPPRHQRRRRRARPAAGKDRLLLGMENGQALENSLGALRAFYALGVRYMTLTHGKNNDWADSATDTAAHGGLTAFGREVVREMNRLGMLVDISHVSPEVMRQVLDLSEAPVIFSHSSARAVVDHRRNVPDDVLARMARNGGVVMVTFIPAFVSAETAAWGKGLETSIFNAKTSAEMERLGKEYAALHGPRADRDPRPGRRSHRARRPHRRPRPRRHRKRLLRKHRRARGARGREPLPRPLRRAHPPRVVRLRPREARLRQRAPHPPRRGGRGQPAGREPPSFDGGHRKLDRRP